MMQDTVLKAYLCQKWIWHERQHVCLLVIVIVSEVPARENSFMYIFKESGSMPSRKLDPLAAALEAIKKLLPPPR